MLIMRWAVMLLLLAAGVAFAYFAATGQQRYKRFGLVIIKWIAIAAAAFCFPLVIVALTWLEPLTRAAASGVGVG